MPIQPVPTTIEGQPAVCLRLPEGDRVTVALQGAQALSWVTGDGVERLYSSPKARWDGHSPMRAGVPLCWPQFNRRGSLPKHGFARNLLWTPAPAASEDPRAADGARLAFTLRDSPASRALWPHAFDLQLTVALAPQRLRIELQVQNTGDAPWRFTTALHSYLRLDDIARVQLEGLQGAPCWDALRDERFTEPAPTLRFEALRGEAIDRVYTPPAQSLRLVQPAGVLEIARSPSCTETVVWNPGAQLCGELPDMPAGGWRHMLCVEAARIDAPVQLESGAQWLCWQQLRVI
ncbi:MAG: D-hexose-6-phosphate mutarotase [Burkholderiaceae bacterium]|jgi:glucose-6-phosphate 1-epimerase|nr:D-hexose-6-phosphate mutarotase [Burkholderiaceae bacterium]